MNLLSRFIPSLNDDTASEEVDERKERIAFHRRHVRNGPASFKAPTNGQLRRERQRAAKGQVRKARRRQTLSHLNSKQEAANLRGLLQAAGVLPYQTEGFDVSGEAKVRAITTIVRLFADSDERRLLITEDVVIQSLTSALNRWQKLHGQEVTPLSPAYVLPVAVAA